MKPAKLTKTEMLKLPNVNDVWVCDYTKSDEDGKYREYMIAHEEFENEPDVIVYVYFSGDVKVIDYFDTKSDLNGYPTGAKGALEWIDEICEKRAGH